MRILSLAPLAGPGVARLRRIGSLEIDPWNTPVPVRLLSADQLVGRLDGVDVFIVEADHTPAEVIRAAASLRVIGACRGDPSNIDVEAATKAGIPVLRAPGRNAEAVADLALGLILALERGIVRADHEIREGRWVIEGRIPQQRHVGREIASLTVGLIGCGEVGRATARRLVALGARVLGFDPHLPAEVPASAGIEPVSLATLLESSDVVSVHAALTDETRGMLGAAQLARMKDGAFLVNTARYEIVDEEALLGALRSGRLAGAALDHFRNEFLPADHPLASMPNVVLTPHIGGSTVETVVAHTTAMADGLEALLAGREPANLVNPEALSAFLARLR